MYCNNVLAFVPSIFRSVWPDPKKIACHINVFLCKQIFAVHIKGHFFWINALSQKNGKFAFWSVLSLTRIDERVQVKLVCTNRILFTPLIISTIRKPFLAKLNSRFAIASKLFLFVQRPLLSTKYSRYA